MKNKLFNFTVITTSILLIGTLIILIISLLWGLGDYYSINKVNLLKILFSIKLSLYTATISSIIALIISIPVAIFLTSYNFQGKGLVDTLFDLPLVLSPIALGAMILIFFNTFPGRFIETHITEFIFEIKGIILAQFFVIIGLAIRLMKNTFESIDKEYEIISRTLGADKIKSFFTITLPLSKRGIISTFLLVWARAIGEFGATMTIAGATAFKTETIPVSIFLSFESANIQRAAVLIFVLIIVSLTILYALRKIIKVRFDI